MKVYVLLEHHDDYTSVEGVFSTKDKAKKYRTAQKILWKKSKGEEGTPPFDCPEIIDFDINSRRDRTP